jgi:hypothetical protein
MKYSDEVGSDVMIYTPNFIKTGSSTHKLIGGDTQTRRHHGDRIRLLYFK